jgi:hypothetical protein
MNLLRITTIIIVGLLLGYVSAQAQDFKNYTPVGESTVHSESGDMVVKFGVNLKEVDRTGKDYTKFYGLRYVDENTFVIDLISTDCGDKYSVLGSAGKVKGKEVFYKPDSPEILVAKPKTQIARAIILVCGEHI